MIFKNLIWATVLIISSFSVNVGCIVLSEDGGYEVLIAISEGTQQPGNPEVYIENVKKVLESFSSNLWTATNNTFYIKSVELLLPHDWTVPANEKATIQSYQQSEVRVSTRVNFPNAENPIACGGSGGEFVELPFSFFESSTEGAYGPPSKALLNQWARYRWGVWEEHGYPGHSVFPYFYKETPNSQSWSATGCSNAQLIGEFKNDKGEICDATDVSNFLPENCRFIPSSQNQKAVSSLMHFHWLASVTQFCNSTTHNKMAPNKQNNLCRYKSTWEVMETTLDFKMVTNKLDPQNEPPATAFRTVKSSNNPLFYLILDNGQIDAKTSVLLKVVVGLSGLFETGYLSGNTIGALGRFPSEDDTSFVSQQVDWSSIATNGDKFAESLIFKTDGPKHRNFGKAVQIVAENIKKLNPIGGAVLLMFKTGSSENSFENIAYEEEVLAILKSARVRTFAIELGKSHLSNLALETYGNVLQVKADDDENMIQDRVNEFIDLIRQALSAPVAPLVQKSQLIYKGLLPGNKQQRITISTGVQNVEFHISLSESLGMLSFFAVNGEKRLFFRRDEWNEGISSESRIAFRTNPISVQEEGTQTWTMEYSCIPICNRTMNHVMVFGNFPADGSIETDIQIKVFTTATNNIFDFAKNGNTTPFAIFAKITNGEIPLRDLSVTAFIREGSSTNPTFTFNLLDDGLGSPDSSKFDGIFSANFIPTQNGVYRISLQVEHFPNFKNSIVRTTITSTTEALEGRQRLLPVDQGSIGCKDEFCGSETLKGVFAEPFELLDPIILKNVETFQIGRPVDILDFVVSLGLDGNVNVSFTSPQTLGGIDPGIEYFIYEAPTHTDILDGNMGKLTLLRHETTAKPVGQHEEFSIQLKYDESRALVLSVKTINKVTNLESGFSNIVGVYLQVNNPTKGPGSSSSSEPSSSIGPSSSGGPSSSDGPGSSSGPSSPGLNPTSSTEKVPDEDSDKPFFETTAGIIVIILIVLAGIGVLGFGFYLYKRKRDSASNHV